MSHANDFEVVGGWNAGVAVVTLQFAVGRTQSANVTHDVMGVFDRV
jgi:hypothetical protein